MYSPTPGLEEAQGAKLLVQLDCVNHKPSCLWVQIPKKDSTDSIQVPVRIVYHKIHNHPLVARYYPKMHDQMLCGSFTFLGCPVSYDGLDYSESEIVVNTSAKYDVGKVKLKGFSSGGMQTLSSSGKSHSRLSQSGSRESHNRGGKGNGDHVQRRLGGITREALGEFMLEVE